MQQQNHTDLMRLYLETQDVAGLRKLWAHMAPHLPQPKSDYEVQVMMHSARTQSVSLAFKARAYSHRWLLANGLPSGLPNALQPRAEQADFKFAFGVGIAMKVASSDPAKKALAHSIQTAMGRAIEDAFAEKKTGMSFLRRQMADARDRAIRTFGGPQVNLKVGYDFSGLPAPLNDVR